MLGERDLDYRRGSLLVRNGKEGRRREIGMDVWGWEQLRPWLAARVELPVGPLLCVIDDPTRPAGAHGRRSRWTLDPATASPNQASATKTRAGLILAPGARPPRALPATAAENLSMGKGALFEWSRRGLGFAVAGRRIRQR